ncbi:LacI family DNA-binding transcriptional regulator [Microbacterium sp. GCS4]|uniref:LacI family DNA-binding transcriptional regulator n=1 Tax=Microbacterium sp. GCS4 TaxID=1692239 RepID=UPI001F33ABE2|nr:LacI family DNA-binding transcriptional regulator [Microbacterium sp. GCS4]
MDEVARHAGVSTTTVSHVLNQTRKVNEDTQLRVEAAVAELGYRRNSVARTLAGGRSHTVGLAISGLANPYFGPLIHTVERRVSEAGFVLILGDTHDEAATELKVIDSLLDRQVDGLIVAPSPGFADAAAARVAESDTPVVFVDRGAPFDCDRVTPENRRTADQLTTHLIEHGHRRIAAIAGLAGLDSTDERLQGYRDAMKRAGLPIDEALILRGDSRTENAERVVGAMLGESDRATGIVAFNNAMTLGAMRAAKSAGLRIPDDLALVSYDDFEWADLFTPGLTCAAQDVAGLGRVAVELLFDRMEGDTSPFAHRVIDTTFHRRDSCGCPVA